MRPSIHIFFWCAVASATLAKGAGETPAAQPASREGLELFERNIRPVLAQYCYECHSAQAKKVKGKLLLDSRAGILKGGQNGAVVIAGDPEASRLIAAIRWTDSDLKMPPKQKLSLQQIEKFEEWVRMGAPDPRDDLAAAKVVKATTNIEEGRKWWAFTPMSESASPVIKRQTWPKQKFDYFVLAELETKQVAPSAEADPRTLIQRAYLDLVGLRPTFEQVEAF